MTTIIFFLGFLVLVCVGQVHGDCRNKLPIEYCRRGSCDSQRKKFCPNTCNTCPKTQDEKGANVPLDKVCKDTGFKPKCEQLRKDGRCYTPTVRSHCKKTCNLCTAGGKDHKKEPRRGQSSSCKDDKSECAIFAEANLCKKERKIMRKYCQKSCGVCY